MLTLFGPSQWLAVQVMASPHNHLTLIPASKAVDASAKIFTGVYLGEPWTQVYFSDGSIVRVINSRVYVNGELQCGS